MAEDQRAGMFGRSPHSSEASPATYCGGGSSMTRSYAGGSSSAASPMDQTHPVLAMARRPGSGRSGPRTRDSPCWVSWTRPPSRRHSGGADVRDSKRTPARCWRWRRRGRGRRVGSPRRCPSTTWCAVALGLPRVGHPWPLDFHASGPKGAPAAASLTRPSPTTPAWNPAWQDRKDSWSSDDEGTPEISWSNSGGEREAAFKKRSPDWPVQQRRPLAGGFASREPPDGSEPAAAGERPFRAANSSQRAAVLNALRDVRVTENT